MSLPIKKLSTCLLCIAVGAGVHAEQNDFTKLTEMNLDELLNVTVKAVTKTEEVSSLSPAVLSIVTAQDIEKYGYQSIAELLSHVVSFVDNYDQVMHNFGVRGINSGARSGSRTIKFMIDGQPVSFRSTSQNFIGEELIPMQMIERVEIIRGPVSALYGANAFLGMVNIVTKSSEAYRQNGSTAAFTYSAIDNAGEGTKLAAASGNQTEKWGYRFGLQYGQVDKAGLVLPKRSPDYQRFSEKQAQQHESQPLALYGSVDYRVAVDSSINFTGHYQQLNSDHPFTDINALQPTGHSRVALENLFLKLGYRLPVNDKLAFKFTVNYAEGDTLGDDRVEVGADSFYLDRRFGYQGTDLGAEAYYQISSLDSLLIGLDYRKDDHQIETFTRVDRLTGETTPLNQPQNQSINNTGIYAQYLKQLSDTWKGVLGFRFDDDSVIGGQESLRIGVVGDLGDQWVVKLLAGSAFQAPSSELLYRNAVQSGDIIGNPNLQAQKAKTFEASLSLPVTDYAQVTATYFYTQVDDLVVFVDNGPNLIAKNSAGSTTQGIELESRFLWQGINGYLNYTYQDTERDRDPTSLFALEYREHGELFPKQMASWGMHYTWEASDITLSWNNRWIGRRPASTQNVLLANRRYSLQPYWNSTLTLAIDNLFDWRGSTVRLQVRDVFNTEYVDPGFGGIDFPSSGLSYSLTFEQGF